MDQPQRVDTGLEEHLAALKTVRSAKRVFSLLVVVSLALQMTFFALARYGGIVDQPARPAASRPAAASTPASQPTDTAGLLAWAAEYAPQIRAVARVAYPLSTLIGMGCALLLAVAMFLGIGVSLTGRLGGARSMIIAFFHALILIAVLCPWGRWLDAAALPQHGAFSSLTEVDAALAVTADTQLERVAELMRFFALPAAALFVVFAVSLRFRRGFLFALERVDPELRVRLL